MDISLLQVLWLQLILRPRYANPETTKKPRNDILVFTAIHYYRPFILNKVLMSLILNFNNAQEERIWPKKLKLLDIHWKKKKEPFFSSKYNICKIVNLYVKFQKQSFSFLLFFKLFLIN